MNGTIFHMQEIFYLYLFWVVFFCTVKLHGAKNIKKYGAEEILVLNPCDVSI